MHPLLRRLKDLALKSSVRDVALISGGAALGQGLTLLASPLLTRLFAPEALGLLGIFMAVASIVGPPAALRYELAIPIARTERLAGVLLHLCVVVSAAFAALSVVVLLFWAADIGDVLRVPALVPYLWLLPFYIFASGASLALSQWAARQKHFVLLARVPLIRAIATVATQLGGGGAALGQGWLVLGFFFGQVAATLGLARSLNINARQLVLRRLLASLVAAAKRFRRFPAFAAPQELINAISQQLPNLVLAFLFGPVVVGLYWLTTRVLQAPVQLIGQSVRQVLYQRVCDLLNRGNSPWGLMTQATWTLFIVGALIFLPIIAFGPLLFASVFGAEWSEAGGLACWVAIWSWAGFVNIPATCGLQAIGAQRALLVYEVFLFIGRNGALLWFAFSGSPLEAIAAYALVGAAFNIGLIGYGHWRAHPTGRASIT